MIIIRQSATMLKNFLGKCGLKLSVQTMVMRMVVAFISHQGRMSCSQAAGSIASEAVHRGGLTRCLARLGQSGEDFNAPLRAELLRRERKRGRYLLILDATLVSQAGQKTENTFSTGNRSRRPAQKRRYQKRKTVSKQCHSFTFALLITPSGVRIPFQIPHYTPEYCQQYGVTPRTTAEAAAELIRTLPLPPKAKVFVIGDAAYESDVVEKACRERKYHWLFPANSERVYAGPQGQRPQLRDRLRDWNCLGLLLIKLRLSTGKYAKQRRISKWRMGRKTKPRVYYAYQEKRAVHNVGDVGIVFRP